MAIYQLIILDRMEARDVFLQFWAEFIELRWPNFVMVDLKLSMDDIIVCSIVLSQKLIIERLLCDLFY
jgi:hypothetical protein